MYCWRRNLGHKTSAYQLPQILNYLSWLPQLWVPPNTMDYCHVNTIISKVKNQIDNVAAHDLTARLVKIRPTIKEFVDQSTDRMEPFSGEFSKKGKEERVIISKFPTIRRHCYGKERSASSSCSRFWRLCCSPVEVSFVCHIFTIKFACYLLLLYLSRFFLFLIFFLIYS